MDNRLKMKEVKTDIVLHEFWKLFKDYITELSENKTHGEELDKNHLLQNDFSILRYYWDLHILMGSQALTCYNENGLACGFDSSM